MPKVVKGVVIGAIIGFATGGLGLLAGQAFGLATGALMSIKTAMIYGAISGGLGALAQSFIKKPNMDMGSAVDRQNLTINPQALGQWVFGETPCAMDIVYTEKVSDDVIVHVVASAAHEVDSFGDFYINDEEITFTGANANGDWFGALQKYEALGTQPQTGLTIPGSQWDGDGSGVAHIGLRWDFGNDNKGKLEGGIPTRITQVVKGSKVYDPRKDTTRGGSGLHRANDQTTWEWSDNWALIVAHYLLGYKNNDKLVYGVGINPDDIDWLQVIAMANVCDETVDSKPRYRVGGIMPTSNSHAQIIGQLEAAVGGKVSKIGGKYYIWCPHNDLVSAGTITNNQIVREIGVAFQPTGNIQDLYNTARGRFIDPDTLYQPTPYAEVDEATAITEDGRVRLMEQDFAIIQDESIAERVAREMVRRSRFSATWTIAMGPEGLLYQPFDVVTLNCDETDNQNQLVRIISMDYSPSGVVGLTLLEEDASIYDTTIPLGTPITQLDPDAFDPTEIIPVTGLTATAISVTGSGGTVSDAFNVSWNNPGGFVRDTEVRYRVQGTTDYSYVQATGFVSAIITPVEPNTTYEIEARHITRTGVKSPWATVTQTSSDTARARAINTTVSYTQNNQWTYDGTNYNPASTTNSATVSFRRGAATIATRTISATLDTGTNTITVNENAGTSGEATTATVSGSATESVVVRVEHTSSGVEAVAQFSIIIAITDVTDIENDIADIQDDLDTLNNTTLPNLQDELDANTAALNTLNTVTLPGLQDDLDDNTDAINTLNTVTLPTLQQELDDILPITEVKISNDAITAPKIAANAVIAGKIAANAIAANEIAADTITGNMVKADTITAFNIASDTITANEIASGTITTNEIATNTITANNIAADTITANEIASNTITANEITAGAITSLEIATGTITGLNLKNGEIGSVKFASVLESQNPAYISGVQGWAIGVSDGFAAAEFDNLVARGNFIAGTGTNERVEITINDSTVEDYRIWVGSGTKTDANGVFWVKASGDAKINATVFGVGAIPQRDTADGSTLSGITAIVNPVVATFDQFTSNGQDVSVTSVFSYLARKITDDPATGTCTIPTTTLGTFGLQKSLDNGSTWEKTGSITAATKANPCQITSNTHGLTTGDIISIKDVVGMVQLNNKTYTVTVVNANAFTLDGVDSTGFGTYTSGGTWTKYTAIASFRIPTTAQIFQDPDPGLDPQCIQESIGEVTRVLIDKDAPADGTNVRYRVVMATWSNFFITTSPFNQIVTNELNLDYQQ